MIEPNLSKITLASVLGHLLFFVIAALTFRSPSHDFKQPIVVDLLSPESKTPGKSFFDQKRNKKTSLPPAKAPAKERAASRNTMKEPVKIKKAQPVHTKKKSENIKPIPAKKTAAKSSNTTVKEPAKVKPQIQRTRNKADGTKKEPVPPKEKKAETPVKKKPVEKTKPASKPIKKKEVPKTKKSNSNTKTTKETQTASKPAPKKEVPKKEASSATKSGKKTKTASKPGNKKQSAQNENAAVKDNEETERLYALKASAAMKHKASMLAQKNGKGGGSGAPSISVTGKGSGPANDGKLLKYFGDVQNRIKDEWVYPGKNKGKLENSILLKIGLHGEVIVAKIQKSSGDSLFDKSTLRAINRADPFPAPPRELKEEIVLRFSP